MGCGQHRIAPDCASQWCRKHCVAQYRGVCPSKKHKRTDADQISTAVATLSQPPPTVLPTAPALLASVSQSEATVLAAPTDPKPRFSSQLDPAFADVLVRDHELRGLKRFEDAQRRDSERRAKQTVKVFSWTVSRSEPMVFSFQAGFPWPFFNLSYEVLEVIGLLDASTKNRLEIYDDAGVGYWMKVEVGHIIEVREGHSIFLRSKDADVCQGLQDHLAAFRRSAPIFYGQLARERQYVRDYAHAWETDWNIGLVPRKRKASASPDGSSSEPTPSPPSPPSSPDIIEKRLVSPHPSTSTSIPTLTSALPDLDETPALPNSKEWPRDFYVCDIVKCFLDCKTSVKRGGKATRTLDIVFNSHFPGVKFKSSTYHDQRNMWRDAPEHLKKRFDEAGHTKDGRWIMFSNAVRRHNRAKQSIKNDVIELSD